MKHSLEVQAVIAYPNNPIVYSKLLKQKLIFSTQHLKERSQTIDTNSHVESKKRMEKEKTKHKTKKESNHEIVSPSTAIGVIHISDRRLIPEYWNCFGHGDNF